MSLLGLHDIGEEAGVDEFEFGAPAMASSNVNMCVSFFLSFFLFFFLSSF